MLRAICGLSSHEAQKLFVSDYFLPLIAFSGGTPLVRGWRQNRYHRPLALLETRPPKLGWTVGQLSKILFFLEYFFRVAVKPPLVATYAEV